VIDRLVLASNNAGKLREFRRLLEPLGYDVVPQAELGIAEADEPHMTFIENALAKARHASSASGLPALADDSGICVDALGGAPGVLSARYAGEPKSDARNNAALVASLQGGASQTGARITTACWCWSGTRRIRSRSSPKASGTAASSTRRAAAGALVTTRISRTASPG